MTGDGVRVEHRAVDHRGRITCAKCGAEVPLPRTEPWLSVDGESAGPPQLMSLRCLSCGRRVYLDPWDKKDRENDEAQDIFNG